VPLPYNKNLKPFCRDLRKNMTDCEYKLWQKIRRKQILGVQFYRQKPIGPYILDFYAHSHKIAIEVDGGQHYLPEQMEKDISRDAYLASLEIRVLRFDNLSVLKNCDGVLQNIADTIALTKPINKQL
jgi:very-short-patch-repair endonuclease